MDKNVFDFQLNLSTERLIGDKNRKCLKKDFHEINHLNAENIITDAVKEDYEILKKSVLRKPKLILSIKGEEEDVDLTEEQKTKFIEGITQIGNNASTWIITGGFNHGVAKLVGEAGKQYRHLIRSKERRFQLIGIGLWSDTKDKESINEYYADIGHHIKKINPYIIVEEDDENDKETEKTGSYLNAYHDLFILCDSGKNQEFPKVDILQYYRIKFESKVAELAKCPLVQITINGFQETVSNNILDFVGRIKNRNSIFSIKGCKGETDLVCHYLDQKIVIDIKEIEDRKFKEVIFDVACDYYDKNEISITDGPTNFRKIMLCIKYNQFQKLYKLLNMEKKTPDKETTKNPDEETTKNPDEETTKNPDEKQKKNPDKKILKFRRKINKGMKKYNIILKVDSDSENIYENLIDFVLFRRLLQKKYDLVVIAFRFCSSPLISILICAWVCQRKSLFTEDYQLGRRNVLKYYENKYLTMAEELLKIAACHNFKASQYLIIRKIELFQRFTCLDVLKKASFYKILLIDSCHAYLIKIWVELFRSTKIKKQYELKKKLKNEEAAADSNNIDSKSFSRELKDLLNKQIEPNYGFWFEYPSVKYILYIISYMIHLALFTYFLLVEFPPKENIYIQYIAYAYSFGYIFDFFNNIERYFKKKEVEISSIKSKIEKHFLSIWNYLDLLNYCLFIAGFCIRQFTSIPILYSRSIFAIYLSLMYLRFLQLYYAYKFIGPQIISFGILLKDVLVIVLIFLLVLLSYGTLAQALLFPNSPMDSLLLKNIVYQPYWQLFGELNLDYVEGNRPLTNMNNSVVIPQKNAIVIVGFGVYMLLSNILLMNLLIAMFGISFTKIQKRKNEIWAQQFLIIIEEFEGRTMFPPPLSCIEIIFRLFRLSPKICRKKCCNKEEDEKQKELMNNLNEEMDLFEKDCLLKNLEKDKNQCQNSPYYLSRNQFKCSQFNITMENKYNKDD